MATGVIDVATAENCEKIRVRSNRASLVFDSAFI